MPSFLSAPHSQNGHYHKALRVRWKRNNVVWCFLCNCGNMPQIPAMMDAASFFFISSFLTPKGKIDIIQVQPVSHRLFTPHRTRLPKNLQRLCVLPHRQITNYYKGLFHWHLNTTPSSLLSTMQRKLCFFNTTSSGTSSFQQYQNISMKRHTHGVYNCSFSSSFLVKSEALEESHI